MHPSARVAVGPLLRIRSEATVTSAFCVQVQLPLPPTFQHIRIFFYWHSLMDTLGIEPRAPRMLSGCDTTTPWARLRHLSPGCCYLSQTQAL